MSGSASRRLRRLLRRAARHPRLESLAWRVRARRRARRRRQERERGLDRPRPAVADRRARIAVPTRIREVESRLAELAAQDETIVAGPWLGGVDVELLYWIPFLRWFSRRFDVPSVRIAARTRPGAAPWYADVSASYGSAEGEPTAGRTLDPSLLDEVCTEYWRERGPLVHVLDRLVYARAATPAGEAAVPPGTIAFWPLPGADEQLLELVERVAASGPAAVLDPPDAAAFPGGRALRPLSGLAGAERTRTLTAVVAASRLLVGPWDGRLLLGPMLGVPTVALTEPASASAHLDLAIRAARALDSPLLLVDRGQLDLVSRIARATAR